MSFNRFAVFAASVAAVLASVSAPLSAQTYKAKVTMPFETRWGTAVLPAGNYVLTAESAMAGPWFHIRGEGLDVTVLTGPINITDATEKGGHLDITDVNGTRVVTKLYAGLSGKEYNFAIPKDVKSEHYGMAAIRVALPLSSTR